MKTLLNILSFISAAFLLWLFISWFNVAVSDPLRETPLPNWNLFVIIQEMEIKK